MKSRMWWFKGAPLRDLIASYSTLKGFGISGFRASNFRGLGVWVFGVLRVP